MLRRVFLILSLAATACSASSDLATTTTAPSATSTTAPVAPPTTTGTATTTTVPASLPVAAGVLWDVRSLTEMGMPTESHNRSLSDLLLTGDRLIATGRDGGRPMVLISDDGGEFWRSAQVEMPSGAEAAAIGTMAERDGTIVAVGSKAHGCPTPETLCDDFTSAVWRSTDRGETWIVVDTPTMSLTPESAIVDVVTGPDGFVAVGNVNGPAPNSSLLWTSANGLAWSEGIPLPATTGGFVRADALVAGSDLVVVTGDEVLCGDWYDNGFWVITAGFVQQGRAWTFQDDILTPIDLAATGVEQPPVPDCPDDGGMLDDSDQYWSGLRAVTLDDGRPALVYGPDEVAVIDSGGAVTLEAFEPGDRLDGEALQLVRGSDTVIGIRDAEREMMRTRAWVGGSLQPEGPPIPTGGNTVISSFVALGDAIVGVGFTTAGITEGVVWRSTPGSVGEDPVLTCQPVPGADCRGVDLRERDLSGRGLSGIDLRHADLTRTNLSGTNLSGAFFASAELSGVNLAGADLTGAHLAGVDLRSYLDDTLVIADADFTGADLRGARVELTGPATFDEAVADDAFFSVSGNITGVSFHNASMIRTHISAGYDTDVASLAADFTGATMENAYFSADMTGSVLAGVPTSAVIFAEDAVCPDGSTPVAESWGINRCSWDD